VGHVSTVAAYVNAIYGIYAPFQVYFPCVSRRPTHPTSTQHLDHRCLSALSAERFGGALFLGATLTVDSITASQPKTPSGFHAFLLADVDVVDFGQGEYVDVVFRDGTRFRSRASAEILRLGPRLRGQHRVTLHFRTDLHGALLEPLHLYRRRDQDSTLEPTTGTYWSAVGLALPGSHSMMVYLERARTPPFQISFKHATPPSTVVSPGTGIRLTGVVRAGQLIAVNMSTVEPLLIPERWRSRTQTP
jgi:hypothetical protein